MSIFSKLGALIFAPTDAAGNPRQVNNHDAQVWSTEVERIIQVALEGGDLLVYGSLSALNVDLDHPAHTGAILIGESIADDGLYMKQGASGSGSWVKIGNVPGQGFVKATNAGAGTANAIAATTPVAVNETQLILLPITAANTASPVTVAFNGGAALTVKTVSGNDVAAGGLPAGSVMLGVVQGGDFRLLSDQASAGIQAAAEAAQVAAEAALAEMREKSVGAFPDNASADAFLTAEGLTKQKGTIYFNTTADVWRYWDGSAWQTFPYAIVADGGVTEEKLADEAVTFDKTGRLLQTLLDTSDNGGFERVYQNNAAAPFGVKLDPKPSAPWDGGILQGFTFVSLAKEFYSAWDISGQKLIIRHAYDGSYTNASAALDSIMGHGQDINHFFEGDALTLVVENDTRNGILVATPHTTDGGALGNVREYQLLPSGWSICWPNVSADKKHIVAGMIDGSNTVHVRVFNIADLLAGAEGDRSSEYMATIQLLPSDEYKMGAPEYSVVQAVAMDGPDIYVLTGDSGYSTSKYLSRFNLITQERLSRLELSTGKAFANSRGGVTYELEGLEWVYRPDGTKSLWTSVVVRRSGGVGYDNISMPLDIRGFGAVSTGRMPGDVGISSFNSSADVLMSPGENWQIKYYNGPDTASYDLYFSIGSDGKLYSVGRHHFGTFTNLDPSSGTDQGVLIKGDLGRVVASAATVAAQFQNPTDAHLVQFFQNTSLVGNIATTATGINISETSDALLKDDEGDLAFEQARAVLDLVRFHIFRWNELSGDPGKLDEGVFAQELYKVYPKAVTVGGWVDAEGKPAHEGDEGAIYVPWSVDYSKFVTVIGRCVQGVMARQDAFEQRLSSLEA